MELSFVGSSHPPRCPDGRVARRLISLGIAGSWRTCPAHSRGPWVRLYPAVRGRSHSNSQLFQEGEALIGWPLDCSFEGRTTEIACPVLNLQTHFSSPTPRG